MYQSTTDRNIKNDGHKERLTKKIVVKIVQDDCHLLQTLSEMTDIWPQYRWLLVSLWDSLMGQTLYLPLGKCKKLLLGHSTVVSHNSSVIFQSDDEYTAACFKVCIIGNNTAPQFNMLPVTLDVFVERYKINGSFDKV